MDSIDNISHITIMTASIEKMYNKSRIDGRLRTDDLYIIEAINKFLSTCVSSLDTSQKQTLVELYTTTLANSETLCRLINIVPNIIQKKSGFTQKSEIAQIPGIFKYPFNNTFA